MIPPEETRVRDVGSGDLDTIVDVHAAAFPGYFLTQMGPRVLRLYYELVLDYEGRLMLVAEREARVLGFVVGFRDPARFYGLMSSRRRRFVRRRSR